MHPHERVAQRQRQSLRWRTLLEAEFPALPEMDRERIRALAADVAAVLGAGNRFPADQEEPLARLRIRLRGLAYRPVVHEIVDTTRTYAAPGRGAFGHIARETDFEWGDASERRQRGMQTQHAGVGWAPVETPEGAAARAALDALAVAQHGPGSEHSPMPASDTLALPTGHDDWAAYAREQMDATRAQMLST